MFCYTISNVFILYYFKLLYFMLYYILLFRITAYYTILYYIILYYIILYYIMYTYVSMLIYIYMYLYTCIILKVVAGCCLNYHPRMLFWTSSRRCGTWTTKLGEFSGEFLNGKLCFTNRGMIYLVILVRGLEHFVFSHILGC